MYKSEKQKNKIKKFKIFYETQESVFKLFNDYTTIAPRDKHKVKYGDGFKIITPKQML